uniref:Uncharacterized protein n=1 Tax=Romanomermis culicivorax TaxID=13658 RepID=A0A915JWS5_ROMCU
MIPWVIYSTSLQFYACTTQNLSIHATELDDFVTS